MSNIMSFEAYFFIVIIFAAILYAGFLWITRKIQFPFPEGEDSLIMVETAGQSKSLRWPSRLLRPNSLGTYLKVMNVFLLILFQKIFKDRKSMVPLVALWGLCNAVSAILIFLIGANYFNPLIGLILGLLFITSFWPWQTALNMGHTNVATAFFLAGVYASTHIITLSGIISPVWLIIAGIFFGCLFFSSSSAIKYFPLVLAVLVFAKYKAAFALGGLAKAINTVLTPYNEALLIYIITPIILVGVTLIAVFSYRHLVNLMYFGNAPHWLIKLLSFFKFDMAGRSKFTLDHYLTHTRKKIRRMSNIWVFRLYLLWAYILYPLGLEFMLLFLLGFGVAVLLFTLPNIKQGLFFYWHYLRETQIRQKTAFRGWEKHFAAKGVIVDRYFTSGPIWLFKFFLRFIPVPMFIFYASIVFVVIFKLATNNIFGFIDALVLLFVSLSPSIWGEITNSPKLGRVYQSTYPGILLFIGYALYQIDPTVILLSPQLIFTSLAAIFAWNLWKFFTDIFPSRMAVFNLTKSLDALKIKEFYTYKTGYNLHFVGTIRPKLREKYTIHYINNLAEVKDGWIVIPGTSIKTSFWFTDEMMSETDSIKDPLYNKLISTKMIEQIATVKFKTFNSSWLWIMDSEITSFRDLILQEITESDILRGHAWLLHSRLLVKI